MQTGSRQGLRNLLGATSRPWPLALPVLLAAVLWTGTGVCDLYIHFLVDRSGSMWAPLPDTAKILQVAEAIGRVNEKLPEGVAMGLRVYPPLQVPSGTGDPGLRIPVSKENRHRFAEELVRLNPRGKGSLRDGLAKALSDLPDVAGTKLLVLFCDGADTRGISFCDDPLRSKGPEGLRFYVFSLGVNEPEEAEELDCLIQQLAGQMLRWPRSGSLVSTLLELCRTAYRDEVERQQRVAEERRKMEELLSRTRLRVEFQNTLDPFFADSVQVVECLLDGKPMRIPEGMRLASGERLLLFDKAMARGDHELSIRYVKWKDGKPVSSRKAILDVTIQEGKTSHVQCYPRGALLYWDTAFWVQTF